MDAGLPKPEYHPDNVDFKVIIWRDPARLGPVGVQLGRSRGAVRAQSGRSQGAVATGEMFDLVGGIRIEAERDCCRGENA